MTNKPNYEILPQSCTDIQVCDDIVIALDEPAPRGIITGKTRSDLDYICQIDSEETWLKFDTHKHTTPVESYFMQRSEDELQSLQSLVDDTFRKRAKKLRQKTISTENSDSLIFTQYSTHN
jgi:hypothetical protein